MHRSVMQRLEPSRRAAGGEEMSEPQAEPPRARPKIKVGSRHINLPESRWLRIGIGVLLVVGGVLGFLPILGFWMVPLGLLVLSYEFSRMRRWRRRSAVWWGRRRGPPKADGAAGEKGSERRS
jgi:hypothetical protein